MDVPWRSRTTTPIVASTTTPPPPLLSTSSAPVFASPALSPVTRFVQSANEQQEKESPSEKTREEGRGEEEDEEKTNGVQKVELTFTVLNRSSLNIYTDSAGNLIYSPLDPRLLFSDLKKFVVKHDGLPDPLVKRLEQHLNAWEDPATTVDGRRRRPPMDNVTDQPFLDQRWSDVGPSGGISDGSPNLYGVGSRHERFAAGLRPRPVPRQVAGSEDDSFAATPLAALSSRRRHHQGESPTAYGANLPGGTDQMWGEGTLSLVPDEERQHHRHEEPTPAAAALHRTSGGGNSDDDDDDGDDVLEHWERGRRAYHHGYSAADRDMDGADVDDYNGGHHRDHTVRLSVSCAAAAAPERGETTSAAGRPLPPPLPFPFFPSGRTVRKVIRGESVKMKDLPVFSSAHWLSSKIGDLLWPSRVVRRQREEKRLREAARRAVARRMLAERRRREKRQRRILTAAGVDIKKKWLKAAGRQRGSEGKHKTVDSSSRLPLLAVLQRTRPELFPLPYLTRFKRSPSSVASDESDLSVEEVGSAATFSKWRVPRGGGSSSSVVGGDKPSNADGDATEVREGEGGGRNWLQIAGVCMKSLTVFPSAVVRRGGKGSPVAAQTSVGVLSVDCYSQEARVPLHHCRLRRQTL